MSAVPVTNLPAGKFWPSFFLALAYGLLIFVLLTVIHNVWPSAVVASNMTLSWWDASIYYKVAQYGYYYSASSPDDTGVFVLFPWVWRLLHTNYLGMAVANYLIFSIAFSIVCSIYKLTVAQKILWLSTPSLYFMMVPYSEAVFALTAAIAFYGVFTGNRWVTWAGLFLLCLARATAVFLLPSLLVMELMSDGREYIWSSFLRYLWRYALPVVAGSFAFILIQYADTGQWMPYYKGQVTNLGHRLSWPALPFSDFYGAPGMLWLNALSLAVCFIALVILINKLYKWFFAGTAGHDKLYLLTLAYLPVIMFTMVFMNPKWGSGTTNLLGMHRYVFCSPFIFVLLYNLIYKEDSYSGRRIIWVVVLCNLVWLTFSSYILLQKMLLYNAATAVILIYVVYGRKKPAWMAVAMSAINMLFQMWLFHQFLTGAFTE